MNERERKEFEDYFKTTKFYENMVMSLECHNFPAKALDMQRGKYKSIYVQLAFDSWQASANREGYKLVPLEPTVDIMHIGDNVIHYEYDDEKYTSYSVYKAMIGAVDDH